MPAFVAIDAGTGGGKCVVFDERGHCLGSHRQRWSYDVRCNAELPFVREFSFDATAFWQVLCDCVRKAIAAASISPRDIAGIAGTSQREGCVFLDAHGSEVYAGPNIDARGFREGMEVIERLGTERLYRITGHSAPFIFPLSRYLWFRKHGGATVAHLLMINDWVTYRLTGVLAAEPTNAVETMLFDLEQRTWSDEILQTFDIPATILPAVGEPGDPVGNLCTAAAEATGLLAGTPVFLGGADTQCALLGSGGLEAGTTAVTLGTTTPVQTITAAPVFDPQATLWAGCHVVPDRWVLESNAGDTGDAYRWLLELFNGEQPAAELYRIGDELASQAFATPTMLFAGPTIFNVMKMNVNRPGAIFFPFPAIHVRPDRAALVRGFLESIGYAVRANLEQLEAVSGGAERDIIVSGGMTRSSILPGMLADIIGRPLLVAEEAESAALGCAILVAASGIAASGIAASGIAASGIAASGIAASGAGRPLGAAASAMIRHRRIEPDAERHERYAASYSKWRELYDQLDATYL